MARLQRVFVDTNELFPFTIMDALLTPAELKLFRLVWTDELLDEWERAIVRDGQRSIESARSVSAAMRTFFARGRVEPSKYVHLVDESLSADPDDRVHVAACLSGDVDVLVTKNRTDFPLTRLETAGVVVRTADEFSWPCCAVAVAVATCSTG